MSIKFKNVVNPNMEMLVNSVVEKFGDWIESISTRHDEGLFVNLSYDNKYNAVYGIKNKLDIDKAYEKFSDAIRKHEKHYRKTNVLKAYLKDFNEEISVVNMMSIVDFCKDNDIELIYQYDLFSIMSEFRLTKKSIIAYDAMDNKVIFNSHSNKNYKFCKSALMVSKL